MKKIRIFTTPKCGFCDMAKSFFRQNNLQYEELNVATDEVAREEMVRRSGGFSVPVIDIDGQLMLGYNIEKLRNLLK